MANLKIGEKIKVKRRERELTQEELASILLLNILSSAPNGRIVDLLHMRDLYKSKSCHVVVQGFFFNDGQMHLMDDGIDLGVVFDLVLCLKINRRISGRAFFDADRLIAGKILLLDVPQSVSVAGKADSHKLTFAILTSQIIQVVTHVVAKEADHLG